MHGSLSCPACGTSHITLGSASCPGCGVGFAAPVAPPTYAAATTPSGSAAATAVAPPPPAAAAWSVGPPQPVQAGHVAYATFGQRFLSGLLDMIIVSIVAGVVLGWEVLVWSSADLSWKDGVAVLFYWTYYAGMQSSSWQATLGMRALDLRVLRQEDNEPISFARATGRHFASYVSTIILMIGYVMIAFTERRQALHDKLASTVVVRDQ